MKLLWISNIIGLIRIDNERYSIGLESNSSQISLGEVYRYHYGIQGVIWLLF